MSETLNDQTPAQEFATFVDQIPDRLDVMQLYRLTEDEDLQLSRYCSPYVIDDSQVKPFPTGHIYPEHVKSVESLMSKSGNKHFAYHAAHAASREHRPFEFGDNRQGSRAWESAYAGHVKDRHKFHLAFLQNLEGQNNDLRFIFEEAKGAELLPNAFRSGKPTVESDKLFDYAEWLSHSLLNVLFENPDKVSPEQQQNALKIFANEIGGDELENMDSSFLYHVGQKDKATDVGNRLPLNFQVTHEERSSLKHENWASNKYIKEIFGDIRSGKSFGSACNQLIIDHPNDFVQVLLLNIAASTRGNSKDAVKALHVLGRCPQPILDAVINEKSSFRTIHEAPNTAYEITEKELGIRSLFELNQSSDVGTLRVLLAAAQEKLGGAEAEHVRLEGVVRVRDGEIDRLKARVNVLNLENNANALFKKHGLDKDIPYQMAEAIVKVIRSKYKAAYHPKTGTNPDAEKYSQLDSELNSILRFKSLRHNDAERQNDPIPAKPHKIHKNTIMWDDYLASALKDVLNSKGHEGPVSWSSMSVPAAANVIHRYVYSVDSAMRLVVIDRLLQIFEPPTGKDNRTYDEKMAHGYLAEFKIIETDKLNPPK